MKLDQEQYYLNKDELTKSCLLTLHDIIVNLHKSIKPCWKYRTPMFCVNNKMFCYLWIDKITKQPYIGFVDGNLIEHPKLIQGNRNRMKILPVNPNIDLPINLINELLQLAFEIKTK